MMKYKILLADDEPEILESLSEGVDWQAHGFSVLGRASNGLEAWNIIESELPDLLITDIKMPYMDGLQLAAKIREKYDDMKIVIFSGYDDFSYAKEAIRYRVEDYIMKPVNSRELGEALEKIRLKMDDERDFKRNIEKLKEKFSGSISIVKERALNQLIRKNISDEVRSELREHLPRLFEPVSYYNCAVIKSPGSTENNISEILKNYVDEILRGKTNSITFRSADDIAVIFLGEESEKILNALWNLVREVKNTLSFDIYVGLGDKTPSAEFIGNSYDEAIKALSSTERMGSSLIYYPDINIDEHGSNASLVAMANSYIREKYADPELTVETVADATGFSHSYFSSVYKRETGEACSNYITKVRMEEAKRRLDETEEKTYMIAEKTGYSDVSYFSYCFKRYFGVSPTKYRKRNV